jgi:hypothetical protein
VAVLTRALVAALLLAGAARAEPVLIAHPSCPVASLTQEQARRLLLGEDLSWSNGDLAQLVELSVPDPVVTTGYLAIAHKTVSQVRAAWNRLVFAGRANPPLRDPSFAEVRAEVARLPGAFAVIDSSAADATVKIVFRVRGGD